MDSLSHQHIKALAHDKFARISEIDFDNQKRKMHLTLGWTEDAIDAMERQYRQFLALKGAAHELGLEIDIVPNRMIDEFWHLHILDTAKYAEDCQAVFGFFLHHYPYFGIEGDQDRANWISTASASDTLWQEVFGEGMYGADDADPYALDRDMHQRASEAFLAEASSAVRCRTQCKPQKCR